jgi:tripartite-type tricarboxylate transporter receptor subunit TctC
MNFVAKIFLFVAAFVLGLASTGICAEGAKGEAWKAKKAITLVIPTATGMIYDSIGRVFASDMGKIVGQPIIVQNVVGAGMALGSQQVYQVKPDGYTIHYAGSLALIVNQYVYNAKYDWRKFEYLAQIYDNTKSIAVVAVTGTKSGLNTWNDVLKLNRPVRFGITGKGSPVWVSALSLAYGFGLKDAVYVTGYKGGAEMLAGVARGECDVITPTWTESVPWAKNGDVRPLLGISNKHRVPGYPEVPITGDLGHPEVEVIGGAQHMIMAPPGTPREILKVLSEAAYAAASGKAMEEYQKKAVLDGTLWAPLPGEETVKTMEKKYKALEPFFPVMMSNK